MTFETCSQVFGLKPEHLTSDLGTLNHSVLQLWNISAEVKTKVFRIRRETLLMFNARQTVFPVRASLLSMLSAPLPVLLPVCHLDASFIASHTHTHTI